MRASQLGKTAVLAKSLDRGGGQWEITTMKTLKVDAHKRIRIADLQPGQVLSYTNNGDDTITLALLKAETKQAFPPGSLLKYFTREKNREELSLLAGCSLEK